MDIILLEEKHIEELTSLARHTFHHSYKDLFKGHPDEEDFKEYVSTAFTIESFLSQMQNSFSSFYGVFSESKLVAYIKINLEGGQNLKDVKDSLELERIYIHESQQGKGMGSKLMSFSKDLTKEAGLTKLWLLVWERNTNAMAFYKKMGFVRTGDIPYKFAEPELDVIMTFEILK